MENNENILDEKGIKELFEHKTVNILECIKSDWLFGITCGNKYSIKISDGQYLTFENDHGNEVSMKIKNATEHFVTIISSRKRKFNKLFKK